MMLKTDVFKSYSGKSLETLLKQEEKIRLDLLSNPGDIKLKRELSKILYYKGDINGAIQITLKVAALQPKKAEVHAFLGYLYYENEEYKKSIEHLNIASDLDPKTPFLYFLLGNTYSRAGKIKEAIHYYDLAIFLDFDIYQAHLDFAKRYEDIGRYEKALREYEGAFEIDYRGQELKEKIDLLKEKIKKAKN